MPLFGQKQDRTAENQAARAMRDWAVGAPPAELAVELMGAFNVPDGKSFDELGLVSWLGFGDYAFRDHPLDFITDAELRRVVMEAVQVLEHSELVCLYGSDTISHRATRLGLATLADGKTAVRQRIKDRTGL